MHRGTSGSLGEYIRDVNFFQHARAVFQRRHVMLRARTLGGLRSLESMCERREPRRRRRLTDGRSLGRRLRAMSAPRTFRTIAGHRSRRRSG